MALLARSAVFGLVMSVLPGCLPTPPSATQRLMFAARDLNDAASFGRMDVAADLTSRAEQSAFARRRTDWGRDIRVVEAEVSGLELTDTERAEVTVDVSWTRMDQAVLLGTRVRQSWKDEPGQGWVLTSEKRLEGAPGLFGEKVEGMPLGPSPDVHFATKTIR
jgi:hypothetical protein